MLILEVFKPIFQRTGRKKDGTEFKVNYQEAEILRDGKRPKPIEVSVPKSGPYVDGLDTLSASSFRPDDYDRLSLSPYIRLEALDEAIRLAQATDKSRMKETSKK